MALLSRSEILRNLALIDALFNRPTNTADEIRLFSKMAVLEVCGWIEESVDALIKSNATRGVGVQQTVDYIDTTVDNSFGFDYVRNIRRTMLHTLGAYAVEQIESNVSAQSLQTLKSELGNLKGSRDTLAHTHLSAATPRIEAPSVTHQRFQRVEAALRELERAVRMHCGKR